MAKTKRTDNTMALAKKDTQRSTKHYIENSRSSNMNPSNNQGWSQMLCNGEQFLLHTWDPSCYWEAPRTSSDMGMDLRLLITSLASSILFYTWRSINIRNDYLPVILVLFTNVICESHYWFSIDIIFFPFNYSYVRMTSILW